MVDKQELVEVFSHYGKVLNVWVAQNPPGFAFVTYDTPADARDAVDAMNGKEEGFAEE